VRFGFGRRNARRGKAKEFAIELAFLVEETAQGLGEPPEG